MTEENKNSVEETVEEVKEADIPVEDTESEEVETAQEQTEENVSSENNADGTAEETKERKFFGKKNKKDNYTFILFAPQNSLKVFEKNKYKSEP